MRNRRGTHRSSQWARRSDGRVLILKLGVFAMMLAFVAVNRFHLTPRLAIGCSKGAQSKSLGQFARNSAIETVLVVYHGDFDSLWTA
ncbi:CopD family protein [Bradyrhizobium macuxiense]|uniref:CopD family protein n=1 Tax=Bradyrhizobium macuxiense TaxID=1755647 RepID=UPI0009EA00F2